MYFSSFQVCSNAARWRGIWNTGSIPFPSSRSTLHKSYPRKAERERERRNHRYSEEAFTNARRLKRTERAIPIKSVIRLKRKKER